MTPQDITFTPFDTHASVHAGDTLSDVLESLGKTMNTAVVVYDENLKLICVNGVATATMKRPDAFYEIGADYGDTVRYMVSQGYFGEDLTSENVETYLSNLSSNLKARKSGYLQWENRTDDGRRLRHNVIIGADGHLVTCIEDITKLSRTKDLANMAFAVGDAGYWTLRFDPDTYYLSDTLRNMLTPRECEHVEKNGWMDLIHIEDRRTTWAAWERSFQSGEKMDFTYRVVSEKSGVRYFRNIGYPEFSTTGKPLGTICFCSDVTPQRMTEISLQNAKNAAESALLAGNEFLARMSHEIRTPMNGIMGMTDALLYGGKCDAGREELNVIKRSAENLLRVLDDTLEMAKLKAQNLHMPLKSECPRQAITDAGKLWQKKASDNGTTLRIRIHKSIPERMEFDRFRFEQCLNNLLSNAVKFTKDGEITLISKIISTENSQRFVTVVKDTGIGMSPAQQERIFTPYAQGDDTIKDRFGGTGLGMSITKNLIEGMGGKLQVQSVPGEGTVFLISLPTKIEVDAPVQIPAVQDLAARAVQNTPAPQTYGHTLPIIESPDDERSRLSQISLLVAEDNETNRLVIKSLFEHIFGKIHFAENGRQAIETLETCAIDIVLMDIHMPVMDGIEATIAIRSSHAAYKNIPIIALTADPEYQQKRVCLNIGMDNALSKPVNRDEIIDACLEALKKPVQALVTQARSA